MSGNKLDFNLPIEQTCPLDETLKSERQSQNRKCENYRMGPNKYLSFNDRLETGGHFQIFVVNKNSKKLLAKFCYR